MFLRQRATQAEYFDAPERSFDEVREGYRLLARVNRLFHFARPFQQIIPRELGEDNCRQLELLDVGAGDGSLGRTLTEWARQKGWDWRVTNLDFNARALQLNPGGNNVVASAAALPLGNQSFDVVIASQMTHHLANDEDVTQHFSEAWRVSRRMVLIHDLHRNAAMYAFIWVLLRLMRMPEDFREDGLLSVRRGWRAGEWRRLAQQAGIPNARVWVEAGARINLLARHS